MKNLSLILLLFCISSCDPVTFGSYMLNNSTDESLTVFFHSSVDVENDTIAIPSNSTVEWRVVSVSGSGSKKIDLYQYYDSIRIESQGIIIIKYTPQTSGKTIYDYSYWTENKKGKRDYEYTFEITQEDRYENEGN